MLQRLITPKLSSEIIDSLVKRRGWSIARIARRIGASREYVLRVHRGKQNFEYSEVESLANACRENVHLFVFEAMRPSKMTAEQRELYELTAALVESHKEFSRELRRRKISRKRRVRANAA
jgi:transcriptional regulator with XRE-family HTH domain